METKTNSPIKDIAKLMGLPPTLLVLYSHYAYQGRYWQNNYPQRFGR